MSTAIKEKESQPIIARVLLISDEAVRNRIDEYSSSKKLKPEIRGSTEKLSADQSQKLEAHLQMHTYLYVQDIMGGKIANQRFSFIIVSEAHDSLLGYKKVHIWMR